jgi:hypothetical protein
MRESLCIKVLTGLVIGMMLVTGSLLLAGSWFPYQTIRSYLDSHAGDGSAEPYTADLHQRVTLYCRILGLACYLAAGTCFAYRDQISRRLTWEGDFFSRAWHSFRSNRAQVGLMLLIMTAAALVRIHFLDLPMRFDEAYTYLTYASQPIVVIVSDYREPNNQIFHSLFVNLSTTLFGDSPSSIRLPALAAGTLLVGFCFLLAATWFDKTIATAAACLCAFSPLLIDYSVNARGYTLIWLLMVLSLLLGQSILRGSHPLKWLILSVIFALGFWTIPVMLYPFTGFVLWFGLTAFHREKQLGISMTKSLILLVFFVGVLTLLLYSPVFIVKDGSSQSALPNPQGTWSAFWSEAFVQTGRLRTEIGREMPFPIGMALAIGLACGLLWDANQRRLMGSYLFAFVGVSLVLRMLPPVRVWFYLLPLVYLTSTFGLVTLLRRVPSRSGRVACISLLLLGAGPGLFSRAWMLDLHEFSTETGTLYDAKAIVQFLKRDLEPEDRVVAISPSSAPLVYTARLEGLPQSHFESIGDPPDPNLRLIVVVNKTHGQNLEMILWDLQLEDQFPVHRAVPILREPSADLYRIAP